MAKGGDTVHKQNFAFCLYLKASRKCFVPRMVLPCLRLRAPSSNVSLPLSNDFLFPGNCDLWKFFHTRLELGQGKTEMLPSSANRICEHEASPGACSGGGGREGGQILGTQWDQAHFGQLNFLCSRPS